MRFLKLEIENFLSYADKQTLKLSRRGLVSVQGENRDDASATSNGSGKSGLFSALVWVLYGRTINGLKGDDVVHRYIGHDCKVSLKMKSEDGIIYRLTRYRKHRKMKNGLELKTNAGVRLTGVSTEETQEKINNLVGLDFTAFTGVLCGQGVLAPFSSLRDSDAKPIMEKVVGLTLYSDAGELASKRLNECEVGLSLVKAKIDSQAMAYETACKNVEQARVRLDNGKAEREKRRKEIEADAKVVKAEIVDLESQIEEAEQSGKEEKRIQGKVESAQQWVKEASLAHAKVEIIVNHLNKEIAEHTLHRGSMGICQSCGGKIEPQNVEALIKRSTLLLQRNDIDMQKKYQEKLKAEKNLMEWQQELRKHGVRVDFLYMKKKVGDKKQTLELLVERLKNTSNYVDGVKKELAAAKETRERAKARLDEIKTEAQSKLQEAELLEFWSKGFGNKGLKSLVLDSQLPFLNQQAARYSRILTDGNIEVRFRTQTKLKSGDETDRFGVDVVNKHGGNLYQANSGGERGKVDLVVGLSFLALLNARSRSKLNVIFLDEPFESLDPEGFDRVLTILTEEMEQYESVFVVTHRAELQDYFSNEITVVKEGNKSRIID